MLLKENINHFHTIYADNSKAIYNEITKVLSHKIPKEFNFDHIKHMQVLSLRNNYLGVKILNSWLQTFLDLRPCSYVTKFGSTFGIGGKVIETRNNYKKRRSRSL